MKLVKGNENIIDMLDMVKGDVGIIVNGKYYTYYPSHVVYRTQMQVETPFYVSLTDGTVWETANRGDYMVSLFDKGSRIVFEV